MHTTRHIVINSRDWDQYGQYFIIRPRYESFGWQTYKCVKTWRAEFPRRFTMEINVWTQDKDDQLVAQGVLYRAGEELCKTEIHSNINEPFKCVIDERVSYTVTLAIMPNRKFMEAYQTDRSVPIEKYDAYEAAFDHDLVRNPPDKIITVKSAWNACFPHNYVMTVQVGTDKNGRLYAQPILNRNKRNFKTVYGQPVDTLAKPFVLHHNKMRFTTVIKGHETKKPETKEESDNAE